MDITYSEEKTGNRLCLKAYVDKKEMGQLIALDDGPGWGMICSVESDDRMVKKNLIQEIGRRFLGQEIFANTVTKDIDIYEELGFYRYKNAFTYVGDDLTDEEERQLSVKENYLPLGYKYESEFEPFKGDFPIGLKSEKKDAVINYSSDKNGVDYAQVNKLLEQAFGGTRDINVTEAAFVRSEYVQFAYHENKLVGCGRAITDGENVIVLNYAISPDYQGLSIGLKLLKLLIEQFGNQKNYLYTHPGAVGFYNRKGFRRLKTVMTYQAHEMAPEIRKGFCLPVGYRFPDEM